jgi:DNA helicase-2/ATP-dependent DNA helicase PcrA
VRQALTKPYIRPVSRKDPQPNPSDDPSKVQFIGRKFTPQEEIKAVADSLARWLPDHPDETVAVLVPRNQRGFELVSELKERGIEYEEILRSTSSTRAAAGALGAVIACVADPASPAKLTNAYKAWRRDESQDEGGKALVTRCTELLRKCRRVEDYLWPHLGRDWLQVDLATNPDDGNLIQEELYRFGELARRWHGTALLPIDQAILTIAQDLFTEPADLAIAHKLAAILRQASEAHSDWRLPELSEELSVISRNERRFLGFSQDDVGFDPEAYRGKALVTTIHKAKGLEWDRVYLMSVNNYDFPSGESYDTYIAERWYVRDHLNLEAEALQQLESAFSTDPYTWYEEGRATQEARLDYVSERLRLLYVGITRARRELVMTWNTGRRGESYPATAFSALQGFWERQLTEARDDLTG